MTDEPPVPLAPIPTSFDIGVVRTPGAAAVLVRIATPLGTSTYWLAPDTAKALAASIDEQARTAAGGLVVAAADALPRPS